MENGYIIIVIIVAAVVGRRSIVAGCLAGIAIGMLLSYIFDPHQWKQMIIAQLFNVAASSISAVLSFILLPGVKGGGSFSPFFLGGGRESSHPAGFICTDEDQKAKRDNETRIR